MDHSLDNSGSVEQVVYSARIRQHKELYSVSWQINVSHVTNTVCTVPDKSVGGAGVAKGGDSGANTEVVRDSAAGQGGGSLYNQPI